MADEIVEIDAVIEIERKVAVITGASSGIGTATALEFADRGYDVVLAARRLEELQDVALQCEEKGAQALAVLTDITSDESVHDLMNSAVEHFGRIDVWINNAGVFLVGKLESLPPEDMKRLMDVNFFGVVRGSHAALEQFKRQGYGTLINVSSVNAAAAMPYISIYSASKAAIRAFDESLRMELSLDGYTDKIHVCTAMPATVDTNIYQNAANYTGREVQAIEPVYDPTYVAKKLYKLTEKPKREKFIGPAGTVLAFQRAYNKANYEEIIGKYADMELLAEQEERIPNTHGNLHAPVPYNRGMRGGWRESRLTAKGTNVALGAVSAAIVGLIGVGIIMSRKHRHSHSHGGE